MKALTIVVLATILVPLFADSREINLYRRLTVFPVKVDSQHFAIAESAWWDLRKVVTADKRFLVATKNFLQKKDAFQARGSLSPSDAIILGRLLDAHVLVCSEVKDKRIHFYAYEGENGQMIWSSSMRLHPSVPLNVQLKRSLLQLGKDFLSSWPYQGYVYTDRFIGTPSYEEDGKIMVKVQVGLNSGMQAGDPVEFISLKAKNLRPLFNGGLEERVFGEGKVVYLDDNIVTVELERVSLGEKIEEHALVKFPKEYQRLRDLFARTNSELPTVSIHSTKESLQPVQEYEDEKKSTVTSLAFLGSLALFLVLAF